MQSPNMPAGWEQKIDPNGRIYLTNGQETKWLWSKWEMKGKRYCEHILTKQKLWQDHMSLPQKVETGCASPAEIAAFRSMGHGAAPAQQAQMQQYPQYVPQQHSQRVPQQQQHQMHAQHHHQPLQAQHNGGNGAYQYPNTQFAGLNLSSQPNAGYGQGGGHPSYATAAAANAQVGQHPSYAAAASGNGAQQGYRSAGLGLQHSNTAIVPPGGYNSQAATGGHAFPQAQTAPWNNTPYQAPQHGQPAQHGQHGQNGQYSQYGQQGQHSSTALGSQWNGLYNRGNHTNQHANPPRPPQGFRSVPQSSSAVPMNGSHSQAQQTEVGTHHKRASRFATAVETEPKRSKTKDTRFETTNSNNFAYRLQSNPQRVRETNSFRSSQSQSTFRPKPTPLNTDSVPPRRRFSNFLPSTKAGKAIVSFARRAISSPLKLAAMHDRDFALTSTTNKSTTLGDDDDFVGDPVIGYCQTVEKEYLRLTSAPRPADVRPPHILRLALNNVKSKWRSGGEDYDWACKQLKSIRQDYKVQHVDTPETLDAYETHARLALENSDLGEFNTCVAQAQTLYERVPRKDVVQDEFAGYRILYNTLVEATESEHAKLLTQLTASQRRRPATRFALAARKAVREGNYHRFADLCRNPPPRTMAAFLLARLAPGVRARALACVAQAYGPTTLPARLLLGELAFVKELELEETSSERTREVAAELRRLKAHRESGSVKDALAFLIGINAVFEREGPEAPKGVDGIVLECKKTRQRGVAAVGMSGLITHAGGAGPGR